MCDKIIKNKVINLRLTKNDYNLLKFVSSKKGMSLTHLITAIVLPYAVKQCTAEELIDIYNKEIYL